MSREANSTLRRISLALLALVALWCVYWSFVARHYWEDDAYIHLEFARSIANGQGFAFNGRVVAGDTAPMWVLLLVFVHAFLVKWMVAGKVLAVLGALVGFSGVYALAQRLARSLPQEDAALFPALMTVLVAASPYTCYWIFSGMEALACAGLACWAVLMATYERPTRSSFLAGCLLAGIGPLVRPEMTFLAALLAVPLLGQWRRLPRDRNPASLAAGLLLFCGPTAAWLLYSLHAFGHMLPNTNAAKRAGPHDSIARRLVSVYAVGFPLVLAGAAGAVVYVAARGRKVWRSFSGAARSIWFGAGEAMGMPAEAWIIVLWTLVVTVFYIVNRTYVQTRYVLPIAPELLVVIVAAVVTLSRSLGRTVYALALLEMLVISLVIARPFVRNKGFNCEVSADLASYIRQHLPPGSPIGTYSIGEVAFLSQYPIIDTGGITRPEALEYINDSPIVQAHWAQTVGAQYFIGIKPQEHSALVYRRPTKVVGWTIHPSRYHKTEFVELWTLRPGD